MWVMIIGQLVAALATATATIAGRAVLALGIGFVTYKGFDVGLTQLRQTVVQQMQGLPVDLINALAFFWVDKAMSVIFSAYAVALALKMAGGAKKMVFK